jgi:cytochrome c oxidase subunit II
MRCCATEMFRRYAIGLLLVTAFCSQAHASLPLPWQIGFQPSASPMMEDITRMHNLLLVIIASVALIVSALLSYVIVRFRASRNPIPSKTSHHTLLEVIWTMIPVVILIIIGIPSLKLLFLTEKDQDAKMTVKAIGHQWYWSYEYPEHKITFDSYMIEDKDLKPGQIRLLSVDHPIIVPINTTVRILIASQDVLHSFAVPSLGIKKDAVPGRVNETWLRIKKEGDYYGQCSELCGEKHGFMPIHVKVVSQKDYDNWIKAKAVKKEPESNPAATPQVVPQNTIKVTLGEKPKRG